MASLRKCRTMANDATSKFLYTILKQLDLKSIDWQEVANQIEITNGHAARMRFSRFKQQMEGQPCTPRKPRPAVPRQKKTKTKGCPTAEKISHEEQNPKIEGEAGIKAESGGDMEPMQGIEQTIKPEPVAKQEPTVKSEPREQEELVWPTASAVDAVGPDQPSQELASFQATCEDDFSGEETRPASSGGAKQEPIVKSEPLWED